VIATFGYDDQGRRTSLTRGNGVVTAYDYDDASRIEAIAHDFANDSNNLTLEFDYNPASQITENRRSNELYSFAPALGTETRSHDGLNRIAQEPGQTLTYDQRGNLTAEGGRTFGYSSDNRLTSMTGGGRTYGFAYDPAGRLHEVTGTGIASRGHAWDGNDAILTFSNGGFLVRTVYGPGENEPLYQLDNQGRRTWFAQDERGSIVAGADATGTASGTKAYDEYGNPTSINYQHGFTGALHLRTTGLYYMRARIYDPKLGRFLQPDPIGYGDGMNMYAYVGGEPVNQLDPSGTGKVCVAPTGSRIRSECVLVDGDRDGNVNEDDVGPREYRNIAYDYRGFIVNFGGTTGHPVNIEPYGKPTPGTASPGQLNSLHVATQFVGAAIHFSGSSGLQRAWSKVTEVQGHNYGVGQNVAAAVTYAAGGRSGAIVFSGSGGYSSPYRTLYGGYTELSRTLLHEVYHGLYPRAVSEQQHSEISARAQEALWRFGLNRGLCLPRSNYPGPCR
jgi:RHS repeat-associated protein